MPIEYVTVVFPTRRLVYIDRDKTGYTNEKLRVDTGTHVFDLGNYANYEPASQEVIIEGTTGLQPKEIVFTRKVET